MGTPMFDQCDLEAVSAAAATRRRWTFLVTAAPMRAHSSVTAFVVIAFIGLPWPKKSAGVARSIRRASSRRVPRVVYRCALRRPFDRMIAELGANLAQLLLHFRGRPFDVRPVESDAGRAILQAMRAVQ